MTTQREYIDFTAYMSKEFGNKRTPKQLTDLCDDLIKYGRSINNLNVQACNYGLSEKQEKRRAKIEKHINQIASVICTTIKINTDPRGSALKIKMPSGYNNDWGGEGYCVPR